MDLAGAFGLADRELVAFVGAGGKKTAADHLLADGTDRGLAVGYTTTTHTPPLGDRPLHIVPPEQLASELDASASPIAFAAEGVTDPDRADEKARGYDPAVLDAVFERGSLDWLLVKADGARRREFKAPAADEPVIPRAATVVVPVASVRAVGRPLDASAVHRPDRVAAITGLNPGSTLTPAAVATVLASDEGGLKGAPEDTTRVIPVVNKADTDSLRETAREVLRRALDASDRFAFGLVTSFEAETIEAVRR